MSITVTSNCHGANLARVHHQIDISAVTFSENGSYMGATIFMPAAVAEAVAAAFNEGMAAHKPDERDDQMEAA